MTSQSFLKFNSINNPRALVASGKTAILNALKTTLSMNRDELEQSCFFWHPAPKRQRLPAQCLYAFTSETGVKLKFFQTMAISPSLNNLNLLPLSSKGAPLKRLKRTNFSMVETIQNLPLRTQLRLLDDILASDEVFRSRIWDQYYKLDFSELEELPSQSEQFAHRFNALLLKHSFKKPREVRGKEEAVNLAICWLATYFFASGAANFENDALLIESNFLNNAFAPFRGSIFFNLLSAPACELTTSIVSYCRKYRSKSHIVVKYLLLSRRFREATSPREYYDALYSAKLALLNGNQISTHRSSSLNACHGLVSTHFQVPPGNVLYADLFGGRARHSSSFSRGVFSWILHPDGSNYRNFEKYTGFRLPDQIPEEMKEWASRCAALLPEFQNSDLEAIARLTNLWLAYLFKLYVENKEDFPADFSQVKRIDHILLMSKKQTFMKFLDNTGLATPTKERALTILERLFALADSKYDLRLRALPINRKFDKYHINSKRKYSTHRDAIPLELYRFIIEENRKDNFAFARSLVHNTSGRQIFERPVFDTDSNQHSVEFFPAIPTVLDLILTSGARSKDALHLDSGEGDEFLCSSIGLETTNSLPTAIKGRQMGALQRFGTSIATSDQYVVGLKFMKSKTGPYSVPYVDETSADLIEKLREWQIRYFPANGPVKLMSNIDRRVGNEAMHLDTFPLFRDPRNKLRLLPPSSSTLREYWQKLLRHCDDTYALETNQRGAFTSYGEPKWDVHSIRVTNITILLENGVPPHIVAMLVGHKSLLMTLYYRSSSISDVNKAAIEAQKSIEKKLMERLLADTDGEGIDQLLESYGSLLSAGEDGRAMLKQAVSRNIPPEIFSHGICPGADCSTGRSGNERGGSGVFRPRACSSCRFRITGPAFLSGLVFRYNSLIAEYKMSIGKEKALRKRIDEAEHEGKSGLAERLRLSANGVEVERNFLLQELALEYRTILMCLDVSKTSNNALIHFEEGILEAVHEQVHDFKLFQNVIFSAKHHFQSQHELPDGLEANRTATLRKIARANDMQQLYFKLTEEQNSEALEAFCNVLAASPNIEDIISGEVKISELQDLHSDISQIAERLHEDIPLLERKQQND